mmetsp:Transcript_5628/g.7393  ORF Transcript_5628/g.7393 Transcript_5628/m.7393 type:complete len:97 (+) Transcript_5628:108-398(+)
MITTTTATKTCLLHRGGRSNFCEHPFCSFCTLANPKTVQVQKRSNPIQPNLTKSNQQQSPLFPSSMIRTYAYKLILNSNQPTNQPPTNSISSLQIK